jgi:hypothetical protein
MRASLKCYENQQMAYLRDSVIVSYGARFCGNTTTLEVGRISVVQLQPCE